MYIIEKLYYSVYFNNSEKEEKEFKFINDLNYLLNISDVTIKNKKITPRLIKNFIEETIRKKDFNCVYFSKKFFL